MSGTLGRWHWKVVLTAIGFALLVSGALHVLWFWPAESWTQAVADLLFIGVPAVTMFYGAHRLPQNRRVSGPDEPVGEIESDVSVGGVGPVEPIEKVGAVESAEGVGPIGGTHSAELVETPRAFGRKARETELLADPSPRVVGWVFVGMVAIVLVTILAVFAGSTQGVRRDEIVRAAQISVGVGAIVGLLIGVSEARAIERTREAERAKLEAAHAEREQETLEFLNGLVRHHLLNGTNVILGYVDVLTMEVGESKHAHLERIRDRATVMAALAEQVGTLTEATRQSSETATVDLAATLRAEVETARDRFEDANYELSAPAVLSVRADGLLDEALARLLRCGATQTDAPEPTVRVEVRETDDAASVRVAVDGALPEPMRETPFEATWGELGLDLYLAETLVDRYGRLTLDRADAEMTIFRVELERIDE